MTRLTITVALVDRSVEVSREVLDLRTGGSHGPAVEPILAELDDAVAAVKAALTTGATA
jgi:hypothetical protein